MKNLLSTCTVAAFAANLTPRIGVHGLPKDSYHRQLSLASSATLLSRNTLPYSTTDFSAPSTPHQHRYCPALHVGEGEQTARRGYDGDRGARGRYWFCCFVKPPPLGAAGGGSYCAFSKQAAAGDLEMTPVKHGPTNRRRACNERSTCFSLAARHDQG